MGTKYSDEVMDVIVGQLDTLWEVGQFLLEERGAELEQRNVTVGEGTIDSLSLEKAHGLERKMKAGFRGE